MHTISKNIKTASTRPDAPLKAAVIERASRLLVDLDINPVEDLVAAVSVSPTDNPIHDGWKKLPSQKLRRHLQLPVAPGRPPIGEAGPDGSAVPRLSRRAREQTHPYSAIDLIVAAAAEIGVSPRTLDHVIWWPASGRELTD